MLLGFLFFYIYIIIMGKTFKDNRKDWWDKGSKKKQKVRNPKKFFNNFDQDTKDFKPENYRGKIQKDEDKT